jgi:methylation protein EvaC
MKKEFLNLGKQPIANKFLYKNDFKEELFFDLTVGFDEETGLVSLIKTVDLDKMFNKDYVYRSSMSKTMIEHFRVISNKLQEEFSSKSTLEIGSNDGVFIKHFSKNNTIAVEPCENFSNITNEMGYKTYNSFWNLDTAKKILTECGKRDLIFSANCMCHIPNLEETFNAINLLLEDNGVFVFEDPSLSKMIENVSYDQLYDEHSHIFSVSALKNILEKSGLEIFRVENLEVHGGSNRIYACKKKTREIEKSVITNLNLENSQGLLLYETFKQFGQKVEESKEKLTNMLVDLKSKGNKICSYGATSKSTTVFNYCNIGTNIIDYIVDTTPEKQGKFSPGVHIPVISPEEGFNQQVNVAFLGAWNFVKEITYKEKQFLLDGGIFVTHVPEVRVISKEIFSV